MKLLIRNLARTTTEAELQALFEAHGTVQSCSLVVDKETGRSKGFCFVEMPRPGEAKAAVKALNAKDVAGSKIRVKKADSKLKPAASPVAKKLESTQGADNSPYTRKTEPKQVRSNSPYGKKVDKSTRQDPLHGVTLKMAVTQLVDNYGWEELGQRINIKCFTSDPSISSSLKFLRKTPWAREKVEALYLNTKWPASDIWGSASAQRGGKNK